MTYDNDFNKESSFERSLPNSSEAERAILGAILLDNGLIAQAIEVLYSDDFYVPSHRKIFAAMARLFERGDEIKPILIGEELKKENSLEAVGGVSFITNLTYGLPYSANIAHYTKIVRGKSMLRSLKKTLAKIDSEIDDGADQPDEIIAGAEKDILSLSLENVQTGFLSVGQLATESIRTTQQTQQSGNHIVGVSTGFLDLDSLLLGLQKSDMIIEAARPGVGKSSLGLKFAYNAALGEQEEIVIVFSMEMPKEQCIMRLLCSAAKVDTQRYQLGYLNAEEWDRLNDVKAVMQQMPLYIDNTSNLTPMQLKAKAMRIAAEKRKKIKFIFADYLQLMSGEKKRYESKQQEVTDISKGLRITAKELQVPLVLASQLNRASEGRTDHRPQLADLRESGALEQDSAVVMFIYRPDMYRGPLETPDNTAEIIVAKNRNGRTGTKTLRFDPPSTSFESLYND